MIKILLVTALLSHTLADIMARTWFSVCEKSILSSKIYRLTNDLSLARHEQATSRDNCSLLGVLQGSETSQSRQSEAQMPCQHSGCILRSPLSSRTGTSRKASCPLRGWLGAALVEDRSCYLRWRWERIRYPACKFQGVCVSDGSIRHGWSQREGMGGVRTRWLRIFSLTIWTISNDGRDDTE